jgi:aryl-alcohol dehydrogenase-like predicted oxidoreductase
VATSEGAPVAALAPLRERNYRRMWCSMTVSHLGTYLQLTAAPWLMLQMTGSPLMVSLVTTALFLPRLFLILPSGALSDVLDRRAILIGCHSVNAVITAVLAWVTYTGRLTPLVLLTLVFGLGIGTAVSTPSYQTYLPDLVPLRLRAQAITMNSAAHQSALIIGPSIGGTLVAVGLAELAFAANAVSFVILVVVLFTLPSIATDPSGKGGTNAKGSRSVAEGYRFVRSNPGLQRLVLVAAMYTLTSATLQALLPNVVAVDLDGDARMFGLLYAIFGGGALLATVTRERAAARLGRHLLPTSIAVFALAAIGFGSAWGVVTSGIALLLAGLTWVWTLTTFKAIVQLLAPRWVRGRVVAVYLMAVAMKPIGAFLGGAVAEVVGSGNAVVLAAFLTLVLAVVASRANLPVLGPDGVEQRSPTRLANVHAATSNATSEPGMGHVPRPPIEMNERSRPMERVRNVNVGRSSVPALGLGCMGMSAPDRLEAESLRTLRTAYEAGIEMFDTADKYGKGHNEELVGRALASVREDVYLATKCGFVGSPGDERPVDGRPEYVRLACERSLQRLGVDAVDLLYLHRVDPRVPVEETVGAMADLVAAGKVRDIGLSEVSIETLHRARAIHPIAAVQSEYSLWARDVEADVLPYCRDHEIAFVGYSPLGIGFLTGRYRAADALPEGNRLKRGPRMEAQNLDHNLALLDRFEELARMHETAPAQLALAWVLDQAGVVAIPGSSTTDHLEENLGAIDLRFDDGVRSELNAMFTPEAVAGARKSAAGLALVR